MGRYKIICELRGEPIGYRHRYGRVLRFDTRTEAAAEARRLNDLEKSFVARYEDGKPVWQFKVITEAKSVQWVRALHEPPKLPKHLK